MIQPDMDFHISHDGRDLIISLFDAGLEVLVMRGMNRVEHIITRDGSVVTDYNAMWELLSGWSGMYIAPAASYAVLFEQDGLGAIEATMELFRRDGTLHTV